MRRAMWCAARSVTQKCSGCRAYGLEAELAANLTDNQSPAIFRHGAKTRLGKSGASTGGCYDGAKASSIVQLGVTTAHGLRAPSAMNHDFRDGERRGSPAFTIIEQRSWLAISSSDASPFRQRNLPADSMPDAARTAPAGTAESLFPGR